jgi:hypothetical protein
MHHASTCIMHHAASTCSCGHAADNAWDGASASRPVSARCGVKPAASHLISSVMACLHSQMYISGSKLHPICTTSASVPPVYPVRKPSNRAGSMGHISVPLHAAAAGRLSSSPSSTTIHQHASLLLPLPIKCHHTAKLVRQALLCFCQLSTARGSSPSHSPDRSAPRPA